MTHSKAGIPHRLPLSDINLLVPMDTYPGIFSINQYGRNPACAAGDTVEIWNGIALFVIAAPLLGG